MFSRAGRGQSRWDDSMAAISLAKRKLCNEEASFFRLDAFACEPLPHAVRENPATWAHFLHFVEDADYPDEFKMRTHIDEALADLKVGVPPLPNRLTSGM
ncbi:hypothetical protein CYMTET_11278 [Cymbomonas tetramitiformis]|nr:hypothetical protein CYMTET_11278 [Cymbomonas tetramitiformis]